MIPNNPPKRKLSKERRKEISARYYQRHRKIIKLAMTLDMPMKEARAMHEGHTPQCEIEPMSSR
jgi:hypothetical protein